MTATISAPPAPPSSPSTKLLPRSYEHVAGDLLRIVVTLGLIMAGLVIAHVFLR